MTDHDPACAVPDDPAAATLRRRLQDEIRRRRQLERQLLSISECEQRRISLELHDGLGQQLSGLAFSSRSLAGKLAAAGSTCAQEAEWLAGSLRDAVGRVRMLSRGLWPVSLERGSLPSALRTLADDFERMYGVRFQVEADGDVPLDSNVVAHHLFRIVQESAHNAIKHGQATHIDVHLEHLRDRCMLTIVSNGRPLDPSAARSAAGLGLAGMQVRADALGAELSIEPLPGGGAEVCVIWDDSAAPRPFTP